MQRTFLVTGSSGFVGRRVVEHLARTGGAIVEVPHRWTSVEELSSRLDNVTDCIHLGWYADPRDYLTAVDANRSAFDASLELVQALRSSACRSLVVAGTCAEYGEQAHRIREDDPVAPWSAYGAFKASLHLVLNSSFADHLNVCWARVFHVVGPGEHPERLLPSVARSLRDSRTIDLSPGEQVRDWIDVDDVARALVHLARSRFKGAVNVGTGRGTTLRSLLLGLAERVGDVELLRFGAKPYGAHDPLYIVADNTRLLETGWSVQHSVESTLDRIAQAWSPGAKTEAV